MHFAYPMAGLQYRVEGNLEIQRTFFLGIGLITSMDLESPVLTNFILRIKNWKNSFFILKFLGKEQWVGLDNIYALTNRPGIPMQLRVSMENMFMEDFGPGTATAYYDTFFLEDTVKLFDL